MHSTPRFALGTALLAAVSAVAFPACYAEVEGPPPAITSAEVDGYEPAYYDGYVVYYDDVGRPFYYNQGAVVWVSPGSPHYAGLVHHWRVYGPAYGRWYGHAGYRYRTYRGAAGYHAYHGYRAPHHRR